MNTHKDSGTAADEYNFSFILKLRYYIEDAGLKFFLFLLVTGFPMSLTQRDLGYPALRNWIKIKNEGANQMSVRRSFGLAFSHEPLHSR